MPAGDDWRIHSPKGIRLLASGCRVAATPGNRKVSAYGDKPPPYILIDRANSLRGSSIVQHSQKCTERCGEKLVAAVDGGDPALGLRDIGEGERYQPACLDLRFYGDERQERYAESRFDHLLDGLDVVQLQCRALLHAGRGEEPVHVGAQV